MGMVNGRDQHFWRFSSNGFWNNIGCLVSAPNIGIGRLRLWEKKEAQNISKKKRKISSISMKVGFYEVCLSYIIYCIL